MGKNTLKEVLECLLMNYQIVIIRALGVVLKVVKSSDLNQFKIGINLLLKISVC